MRSGRAVGTSPERQREAANVSMNSETLGSLKSKKRMGTLSNRGSQTPTLNEDESPPPTSSKKGKGSAKLTDAEKQWYEDFKTRSDWLPSDMTAADYSPTICEEIERIYWRGLSHGPSEVAWYGADMNGQFSFVAPQLL